MAEFGSRDSFKRQSWRGSRGELGDSAGRVLKIVTEMGSTSVTGVSPAFGANAASSIIESREREKKEMQDLNDRLGTYIERVRYLEAQNRKLASDLEALRGRWGQDTTNVKLMYAGELTNARKLMDDGAKTKADIEVRIARLQEDLSEMKRKHDDMQHLRQSDREKISSFEQSLVDCDNELSLMRKRLQQLLEEESRLKSDNDRASNELQKAKDELDSESLNRIDYQNQVQTLLEEIEFLRRIHDQEVKELEALANRDTPADNREYFKNELALAIRDIRNEYDTISVQNKNDMESWYKLKVQEVQTSSGRKNMEQNFQKDEVMRLRNQLEGSRGKLGDLESRNIELEKQVQRLRYQLEDDERQYESALNDRDSTLRKMREECQALMVELQTLMDTKQTLDAEIAIYRKMLEGEESRAGLKNLVEQVVKTHSLQQNEETESSRTVKGETSTKTTFQRSAKGNVTIADVSADGRFVILENTHRSKDEHMGDWKLRRRIDGKKEIVYSFPGDFVLKAGHNVRIWANCEGAQEAPPHEMLFEGANSWGLGSHVQTSLYNKDGDERATLTQKQVQ